MSLTSSTSTVSAYFKRLFLMAAGWICIVLAVLGIFLPLLPTTPFLLLAAFCFSKSSTRFHQWLINHPWFGDYIKNFQEGRGMTLGSKITSVALIWLSIGSTVVFFISSIWLKALLILIAISVSCYLISRPTYIK